MLTSPCIVCVFNDQRCFWLLVSTASAVETSCFVGIPEELFFVSRGVIQVGTLLYDPKSWGLERMLRWSREGKASSRGPPTIQLPGASCCLHRASSYVGSATYDWHNWDGMGGSFRSL